MEHDEVTSLTISMEGMLLTTVIEAQEGHDITTCDIPNVFVQTHMDENDKDGNQTIMKIRGVCVDIFSEIDPIYRNYMVTEGNQRVLYVHSTQAIYKMLVSAMLFHHKLTKALLSNGSELNPYDPCVVNKMVNSEQLTIWWPIFGQLGEVKMTQGPLHDYLGMTLDYSVPGQVSIDMSHYVKKMVKEFPQENLTGASVARTD